jgi:FMN phosphatase YigB (HAD superfamily)
VRQKAIIVDLDGTLCDTKHRQHWMEQQPKDWMRFYGGILSDKPHPWCLSLIDGMRGIVEIIFVSGRPDDYFKQTKTWLRECNGLDIWPLFMRKSGDFRKDSIIKTEIYRNQIEPNYEVLFCVDDRQQVVDAWRELGLTCLQCAKGDF